LEFKPNELKQVFQDLRHDHLQRKKNFSKGKAYVTARVLGECVCKTGNFYHFEDEAEALEDINFEQLLHFHKRFLRHIKLMWLFTGNLTEESVHNTVKTVEEVIFQHRPEVVPLRNNDIPESRSINIPKDTCWIYEYKLRRTDLNEKPNPNSSIYVYFQIKQPETKKRIMMEVLEYQLREEFYDQLRTKEQLGYIVNW